MRTAELNKNGRGTCGHRPDRTLFDSSLVADVLDPAVLLRMEARSARPVWLTVSVPRDARPGKYTGTLTVTANGIAPLHLPFGIEVLDHTLPAPGQWAFHLDLWQHPYAVARLYGVPLWSEEHFEIMRPMMRRLAAAGQKVVTATIMHRPWAGQSYDVYPSMVAKKKCLDGSWQYDYTVFDRWIEFMEEMGIGEQINCFTMIPWALEFDYFDQATSSVQFIKAAPGEAAYEAYWLPFLKDFARHLRTKGWFGHTTISMDEREQDAMLHTIALIRKADPDFKISFQGNKGGHYPAIESEIYDLSMAFNHPLPAEVLAARHAAGKVTTVYTCCSESRPNLFTFSPPAEGAWLPWFAVASGYDGYLRWAYANWNADPLRDSRFRSWGGGDCYIVYPERSSIRMERLVEGIQDAEKIRILRTALTAAGKTRQLAELNAAVAQFKAADLTETNAGEMVARGRETLNKL